MTEWLSHFNRLPPEQASYALLACCASTGWAHTVAARRPYATAEELYHAAERAWWEQRPDEWEHAFASHPRIGKRAAKAPQHGQGDEWSAEEQRNAQQAGSEVAARLVELNHAYEQKFGRTYIVCASGKSAEAILQDVKMRMNNDPAAELVVAATEQAGITRLRLERLITTPVEPPA